MSNLPVEKVEYDKNLCEFSHNAVCPYCNMEHDIESEDFTEPENAAKLYQCDNCESYFAYETEYTISFHTRPLENYYLEEKARLEKSRKKYEGIYNPAPHIQASIDIINNQLRNLESDKKDYLNDQLQNKRGL